MTLMKRFFSRKTFRISCFMAALAFLFTGCDFSYLDGLDNIEDYQYNAILAVPLVNSSLSLEDIFDKDETGLITVDETGLVWITYKGTLISIPASDIFPIPDQLLGQNFSVMANPPAKSEMVFERTFELQFDKEVNLNSITFSSGFFNMLVTAPQLMADGYRLEADFEILNAVTSGGLPVTGELQPGNPASVNLGGSTINLKEDNNQFTIRYHLRVLEGGSPDNAPYVVNFHQNMTELEYEIIYGDIGAIDLPMGSSRVALNLFKKTSDGEIFFESPTLTARAINSFGTPVSLQFNEFYVVNDQNQTLDVESDQIGNRWDIASPATSEINEAITSVGLNSNNSNLDDIMAFQPEDVHFDVLALINQGAGAIASNFIRHNSQLNIEMEVNLPMHGRINFLQMKDTLEMDFEGLPEDIEWIELNILMENNFPLKVGLKIFMADESGLIIDSLFATTQQQNIIEEAPVDASTGRVTQASSKRTIIMLDDEKIDNLLRTQSLVLRASLSTSSHELEESVKILQDYRLGVQIGARIKSRTVIDFNPPKE